MRRKAGRLIGADIFRDVRAFLFAMTNRLLGLILQYGLTTKAEGGCVVRIRARWWALPAAKCVVFADWLFGYLTHG